LLVVLFGFSMNLKAQNADPHAARSIGNGVQKQPIFAGKHLRNAIGGKVATSGGHFTKNRFQRATGAKQQPPFRRKPVGFAGNTEPRFAQSTGEIWLTKTIGHPGKTFNISKQELVFNVRQSWYQTQYLMALEKVLGREDSLLGQFVRAASLKFKTGESNLLEKTTAETSQQQLAAKHPAGQVVD
jgi:hypothetical protein